MFRGSELSGKKMSVHLSARTGRWVPGEGARWPRGDPLGHGPSRAVWSPWAQGRLVPARTVAEACCPSPGVLHGAGVGHRDVS